MIYLVLRIDFAGLFILAGIKHTSNQQKSLWNNKLRTDDIPSSDDDDYLGISFFGVCLDFGRTVLTVGDKYARGAYVLVPGPAQFSLKLVS